MKNKLDRESVDALRLMLETGLETLGQRYSAVILDRLLAYLQLLLIWNRTYNLTAVREPKQMLVKHLLDSLAVASYVPNVSLIDLGSGAGLPGIPLGIAGPDRAIYLLEANGKKARFLREVVRQLSLLNVTVLEARAEKVSPTIRVDSVIARAVSSLAELSLLAKPWLKPQGRILAMKGPGYQDELDQLPSCFSLKNVYPITVPGLDASRYLIEIEPKTV
jgi:16S rRNA (guanine527-N7)-methyltransferase